MEWFEGVFLPDLEKKYKATGKGWLTAKQTAICRRYMERADKLRYIHDIDNKRYEILLNHNDASRFAVYEKEDEQRQKVRQTERPC